MPKADNIINFSLPIRYRDRINELAQNGESIGVCAKRLLIEYLESLEDKSQGDRMAQLEERLAKLESIIASSGNGDNEIHNPRGKTSRKTGT